MTLPRFGGPWTQEKLGILRRYLDSYTTALKNQPFHLVYVDAFAGAGIYADAEDSYADFQDLKKGSASIDLRKAWEIGSLQQRGSQIEPILSLRTSQGVKTTTLGSHIRPQPLAKALLMAGFQYLDILILCHLHR